MIGFKHAINGLSLAFRSEYNFRFHLIALVVVLFFGYFLEINIIEWAVLVFCMGLVLITELLNTAIEYCCNFMEPNHNQKIKEIKDIAAAAVLLSALCAALVGLLIFIPKIIFHVKQILFIAAN